MTDLIHTETLSHREVMDKRDGAVRLWIIIPESSAKLVRDGVSFARIDTLVDGTVVTKANGVVRQVMSWDVACRWMQLQMAAEMLTGVEVLS